MNLNFEKIPLLGAITLFLGLSPLFYLCSELRKSHLPNATYIKSVASEKKAPLYIEFDLPLTMNLLPLPTKTIASQVAFSLDPPRPTLAYDHSRFLVRLPQARQNKRVTLPAIVGLQFTPSQSLEFREQEDQFWLECNLSAEGQIEASLFFKTPEGEVVCKESWLSQPQETPLFAAEEFPKTSPFRLLAEARWWGHDLFAEKFRTAEPLQRIEIGSAEELLTLDLQMDQWLVFKDEQWQKAAPHETLPIAHITNHSSQGLEIEGWEGSSHIRLKIPPILSIPLKTKGEELFSQLRIRSDKQVSCVVDKQCLILRTGDWVLKTPKRWKVLRKKEDKEAFLAGTITGDLFVLDRINAKTGVKSIGGQLFSVKRSQIASIECAQGPKHIAGSLPSKTTGRTR
jgi:hypothetical protein